MRMMRVICYFYFKVFFLLFIVKVDNASPWKFFNHSLELISKLIQGTVDVIKKLYTNWLLIAPYKIFLISLT